MEATPAFERKELWEIRRRATVYAATPAMNPGWKRAFERLADAADVLDAFYGRSEARADAAS